MDKCPPEVHWRIISYACTDDGYTGCSLSLVSRYIHQVSSPYRWQCVSLPGYDSVISFSRKLEKVHTRRPIRHLFLSDREFEIPSRLTETLSFFSASVYDHGARSVSLCLSASFPLLQELTIRARCTTVHLAGDSPGDTIPCNMPNLTHLHLALPFLGFSRGVLQATHNLVWSISTDITHLRLTMLDKWGSRRVVEVIHSELSQSGIVPDAFDLPPSEWDSPRVATASPITWDRLLPDNFQLFAIQPSPTSTFYCTCCMDLRGDVDVMRILDGMSSLADKERFVCMARRPIQMRKCRTDPMEVAGYGLVEAQSDWMERVQGDGGCWREKDDDDVDSMGRTGKSRSPATPILIPNRKPRRHFKKQLKNAFKKLKVW
ncbi:hypothetical protein BDY19DRAFT_222670 [Irpex rosettiformis]|uniref:Uncharacterized protein n=1 Tax=Irpex rosettiformis TaxID=378272 RepID=A0ACB8U0L2_9APHY|nr:hypothetical protein BDY19DRAFT_222670 [Irpex rosettiformis]